jgi:pimeloyl-ACP methyl ester carboxylesterase
MTPLRLSPRSIAPDTTKSKRWFFRRSNEPSWYSRAKAVWAAPPSGEVVIFVHGFGGNAISTWRQFIEFWPMGRAGCDLVFYGYDSLYPQVGYSAAELREFLEQFLAAPANWINPTVAHINTSLWNCTRSDDFQYKRIIIVAYSLGAVIARRALLDAGEKELKWISRTRLVLFAPAHKGAKISKLFFGALTGVPFSAPLVSLVKLGFRSLEGLDEKSAELEKLEEDTLSAIVKRGNRDLEPLKAAAVVFPKGDLTVIQVRFAKDSPEITFPNCGHVDCCKPRPDFWRPIEMIDGVL